MQLRWLKGLWSFGQYKLQYRHPVTTGEATWQDVPIVDTEPKRSLEEQFEVHWTTCDSNRTKCCAHLAKMAKEYYDQEKS